jgi:hypothetical protein
MEGRVPRKLLLAAFCVVMAVSTAPASADDAPPGVRPTPDVAWLVIGIQPQNSVVTIGKPYTINGHAWSISPISGVYRPEDGFIVVKGVPGTNYVIAGVKLTIGKAIFGKPYQFCDHADVYHAEGGKVLYFQSLRYQVDRDKLDVSTLSDLEGARDFLSAHYPGLGANLEMGQSDVMPVSYRCGPSVFGNGLFGALLNSQR